MGNARLDSGIAGNDSMLWTMIKKAKEEGCTEFEIQGAGDRRLWHFKSKYNPQLEVCYAASRRTSSAAPRNGRTSTSRGKSGHARASGY